MDAYSVRARNLATASANKIHDDAVARRYGFLGGLVPGVEVYAYMAHVPAAAWGEAWLRHGRMNARFITPVYDGASVDIEPTGGDGGAVDLVLRDEAGTVCATGRAELRDPTGARPDPARWPAAGAPPTRHPCEPGAVSRIDRLGDWVATYDGERGGQYLRDIDETLGLYGEGAVAHPGWLLRTANWLFAANVELGPWIHTASSVQHWDLLRAGQQVAARGRVVTEYERRGHRFVDLDIAVFGDDSIVATIDHTAIYLPRERDSSD